MSIEIMFKKNFTFISLFFLGCINLQAQNYQISFAGSGATTTVEAVEVQNLTQGINLNLNGSDILYLQGTVGMEQLTINGDKSLRIYPNPMTTNSNIEFEVMQTGLVTVELIDITGKKITSIKNNLHAGLHTYNLSGLGNGIYTVSIKSDSFIYSEKIVSNNSTNETAKITFLSSISTLYETNLKSTEEIIRMQYNDGDLLLLRGVSSDYATVVTITPTSNTTVTFNFIAATDGDGNNYGTVTIGTQTWMTENIKYEYANSDVYPDAGEEYGRLYDWVEAQSVCPSGWHLPSDAEWTTLTVFLGGESLAGQKLKGTGTTHWNDPNTGTNESGFTALPGGGFINYYGTYTNFGDFGYWWSISELTEPGLKANSWIRNMKYESNYSNRTQNYKGDKLSVRCIKD